MNIYTVIIQIIISIFSLFILRITMNISTDKLMI